jgi:polysaccharide export outer membrane protein
MRTTIMMHKADGNEQMPDVGNPVPPGFGAIRKFARTWGPHRRSLGIGIWCAALFMALGASVGCNDIYPVLPVPDEAYVFKPSDTLMAGDEIRVVFSSAPDLSTQQKIQSNGKVSLPMVGEVTAAGRSITSLQKSLTTLYQPRLQDSTVTVTLAGAAAGVYVSGAVLRPGKLPLDRPMTVLEAVMEAGGFAPMANPKQVVVVRTQGGKSRNFVLNLLQSLQGVDSTPFYVRPYDVVFVREKSW